MRLTDYWPTNSRIIEIGASTGAIGSCLVDAGYQRYLAVARDECRRRAIVNLCPGLAGCTAVAASPKVVRQNNADVLILNGWSLLHVAWHRSIRHVCHVAWALRPTPLCWLAMLLALVQCLLGRLAWPKVLDCARTHQDGASHTARRTRIIAFRVRRPRPHSGVRRFIPHTLGIAGMLRRLQADKIRYAVLRWFESLPELPSGEDLDLLVEDAHLEAVRAMLDASPGIQPIDLYSTSGLPGADFRDMPYFPPYLAEELLERAVVHDDRCVVPAPREHFLSLAYHALYHKGASSGIPRRSCKQGATGSASASVTFAKKHWRSQWHPLRAPADHDYAAVLGHLAEWLGIRVPITLDDLDAYLDSQGWRPPHDMLVRLARRNRWVRSLLRQPERKPATDDRLAVFLIRQEALRRGGVERAAQLIAACGFQIIATRRFNTQVVPTIARSVRGGNWGRGPWPISGGPPVAAIVAFDPAPMTPTRQQKRRFPFLANVRLLRKEQFRDAFNEGYPDDQHCNVVHSSDNGREALDYLRIIMPDAIDDILARADSLRTARAA